jgi:uncharacterized membrane protein YdjX (TVP38/TMEM64 family)
MAISSNFVRIFLLFVLVSFLVSYFYFFGTLDPDDYLQYIRGHRALAEDYLKNQPFTFTFFCCFIYVMAVAFFLPGTSFLSIAFGSIFGFYGGVLLASFSSAIGATIAFCISRFFFRNWVQQHFQSQFKTINNGIKEDGALYLISICMTPIFPYAVINALMGISSMRTSTFYLAIQLGMLTETIILVSIGAKLSEVESLSNIFSLELIGLLITLGLVPIIFKRIYMNLNPLINSSK